MAKNVSSKVIFCLFEFKIWINCIQLPCDITQTHWEKIDNVRLLSQYDWTVSYLLTTCTSHFDAFPCPRINTVRGGVAVQSGSG